MSRATFAAAALFLLVPAIHAQPKKEDENSKKVDESIKKALKYLASTQNDDGTWGAAFAARGRHPAITGLAVMAFLSAGHVPGEGPYGMKVEKGIRAVIKMQAPNGLIASDAGHEMYHHGICTLMLAETAGMTQGPLAADVKKALERAVAIVLQGQRTANNQHKGGWRYMIASTDSDISVTGWQIMALRAAKNVGCDVPPDAIDQAVAYVKRCQDPYSGAFRYTPGGGPTTPCTGTSILCLAVTGKGIKQLPEAIKGGNYLMR